MLRVLLSRTPWLTGLLAALAVALLSTGAPAEDRSIKVASTTSTDNSGFFGHILPIFEAETGIRVHVVAVGTGQAIKIARNGDADVLFVHHKPSEEAFVAAGFGVERFDVMYNDFVLVGPEGDPAEIKGMENVTEALSRIAAAKAVFASRGDDSGTHKKELSLWRAAGVDVAAASGDWYRETGSGMGPTLNTASGLDAYTLSDRATWISFQNKRSLRLLSSGDKRLFNQYGVILVNQKRHPHVNTADGQAFIDWLLSSRGQKSIGDFRVLDQQLFFPNASEKSS